MKNVKFTKIDREILNSYKIVVDGLADYLGNGYEIVLHSMENLDQSVIKIINGQYTGRKEGSPITDLALNILSKIESNSGSNHLSYFTKNRNGEPLKATTITIRGEENKVIGLLCMNFYLNTTFSSFLENYADRAESAESPVSESFSDNVDDLIKSSYDEANRQVMLDDTIPYANRNKEIITILNQKGIFQLKDAVAKIAKLSGISRNTVYLHLRNINHK